MYTCHTNTNVSEQEDSHPSIQHGAYYFNDRDSRPGMYTCHGPRERAPVACQPCEAHKRRWGCGCGCGWVGLVWAAEDHGKPTAVEVVLVGRPWFGGTDARKCVVLRTHSCHNLSQPLCFLQNTPRTCIIQIDCLGRMSVIATRTLLPSIASRLKVSYASNFLFIMIFILSLRYVVHLHQIQGG